MTNNGVIAPQVFDRTQLTPIELWRKPREEGVLFHFPSGRKGLVRPVSVDTFLKLGRIPDMLTATVAALINQSASLDTLPVGEYAQSLEMINIFVEESMVWPRVVKEVKDADNEILIADMPDVDKNALFSHLGAPASLLESFRPEPEEPLASVDGEQGDEKAAE